MNFIKGVLFKVGSGDPVDIPERNLAVFGVTRDSGKTEFIKSAVDASGLKALAFRTKRGEIEFEGAKQLRIFFEEKGLTHWRALEGLIAATLEEKVQREPGVRGAIINVCTEPIEAVSLEEIHERIRAKLENPKIRGFVRDVYSKLDAYLKEVLPQIRALRDRFTDRLEMDEPGVYLEDLTGLSDEVQCLLLASVMKKCYEEGTGIIVVLPEVWKFLPQDRGSPVKWVIEKYVREMGAVEGYLWIDCQDLRGVDKKHLRSIDTRLFGRQPDPHEIDELLKALPLPKNLKPTAEQIMTLKLGHFYAKLRDNVELVYVRPLWLPEDVAVKVARGELEPDSPDVQKYKPEKQVLEVNDDLVYKEKYEEERKKREEEEKEFAKQLERLSDEKCNAFAIKFKEEFSKELFKADGIIDNLKKDLESTGKFREALLQFLGPSLQTPTIAQANGSSEIGVTVQPTLTEFTVKVPKRELLEATDQDATGQILLLAHSGWFGERRKITAVRAELERKFNSRPRPGTIEKMMGDLTAKGVLTREKDMNSWTYWLSPGAEQLIKTAEA